MLKHFWWMYIPAIAINIWVYWWKGLLVVVVWFAAYLIGRFQKQIVDATFALFKPKPKDPEGGLPVCYHLLKIIAIVDGCGDQVTKTHTQVIRRYAAEAIERFGGQLSKDTLQEFNRKLKATS